MLNIESRARNGTSGLLVNIVETLRAGAKMHGTTFKDFDICRRIAKVTPNVKVTKLKF